MEKSGDQGVRRMTKELKEKIRNKGDEEIDEVVQELGQLCRNKNKADLFTGLRSSTATHFPGRFFSFLKHSLKFILQGFGIWRLFQISR